MQRRDRRELFMKEHSTIPLIPIPSESKRVPTSETSVVSYAMAHTRFSQEHSCTPLLIFRDRQFLREYLGNLWKRGGISISSEFYANILRDDCSIAITMEGMFWRVNLILFHIRVMSLSFRVIYANI